MRGLSHITGLECGAEFISVSHVYWLERCSVGLCRSLAVSSFVLLRRPVCSASSKNGKRSFFSYSWNLQELLE